MTTIIVDDERLAREELKTLLKDKHESLFSSVLEHKTGKLSNTSSLKNMRGYIARIKTVIRKKEVENGKAA